MDFVWKSTLKFDFLFRFVGPEWIKLLYQRHHGDNCVVTIARNRYWADKTIKNWYTFQHASQSSWVQLSVCLIKSLSCDDITTATAYDTTSNYIIRKLIGNYSTVSRVHQPHLLCRRFVKITSTFERSQPIDFSPFSTLSNTFYIVTHRKIKKRFYKNVITMWLSFNVSKTRSWRHEPSNVRKWVSLRIKLLTYKRK